MPLDTNPLLAVWHVHMLGQGLGERTVADRLRVLVQFERDVGGRAEDAPADVVALWLAQPWSRGTREHYWSVLKAWWRWLRVSEMASFRGEYLDAATRRVRILGKGESDHVLPVHDQVLGVAARYPTAGPWFPSPTRPGHTVTANSVSAVVSRIVQTLMRHRSLATTARYMKVFEAQQRDALAKLPAVWDGPL